MKLVFLTQIIPKANFERLLDLYLKDKQCLKFACLLAIKIAQQTNLQYIVTKNDQLQWDIGEFKQDLVYSDGYAVDYSGKIFKVILK